MNNIKLSVSELEILAILFSIMVSKPRSKLNIYTNSSIAYQEWNNLMCGNNLKWETRHIWNHKSVMIWKTIFEIVNTYRYFISLFKVKSHSGNFGSDVVNQLSRSITKGYVDINGMDKKIDKLLIWEYLPYWRGNLIKDLPREFMKSFNQLKYKAHWLSLNTNRTYRLNINALKVD